jgi:adenine-specific DNA methylase
MDRQDSSVPDHDPVASGPGRIPLPDSADVRLVMRERYDEPVSDRAGHDRARVELTRQVFSLADSEYERGLRDAFEAVLDQLKRQGPVYVMTLLDEMDRAPARSTLDALRRDGR